MKLSCDRCPLCRGQLSNDNATHGVLQARSCCLLSMTPHGASIVFQGGPILLPDRRRSRLEHAPGRRFHISLGGRCPLFLSMPAFMFSLRACQERKYFQSPEGRPWSMIGDEEYTFRWEAKTIIMISLLYLAWICFVFRIEECLSERQNARVAQRPLALRERASHFHMKISRHCEAMLDVLIVSVSLYFAA